MSQDAQAPEAEAPRTSTARVLLGLLFVAMAPVSYAFEFRDAVVAFLAPDVSLARPEILFLAWLVPGVALLVGEYRKARQQKLGEAISAHLLPHLTPSFSPARRRLKGVFLVLAWILLVVTWAGPQWGTQVRILQRKGIDIIVAIDLSESMLAGDIATSQPGRMQRRLHLARKKVRVLMDLLSGERIGIIAFAGKPVTLCPLTTDHNTCAVWLDSLDPSVITQGGTALATTIKHAVPMFSTSGSNSRALILLTDGDDHEKNTKLAADFAKKKGIHIYALGFGSPKMTIIKPDQLPPPPQGQPVDPRPIKTRLNEKLLQTISATTLGLYRRAEVSHRDIRALFDHARQKLEAKAHQSRRMVFREQRFAVFMGIAMFFLLLHWGWGERK